MGKAVNLDMFIIARESRGLTQKELARLLSVSQGKISKIESGLLGISEDMLKKLAQVLDYPENFFSLTDPIYGTGYGLIYHRKRQNISHKVIGKIHSQMNIQRIHLSRLLQAVDIGNSKIPQLDIDEYNGNVEEIARIVRATWLLPRGPIKNLTKSIEDAGGVVFRCDFGTNQLDAVSQWIQGLPPIFFVNNNLPGDRLRFTLAHELGHVIMHRMPNPNMEKEAHSFAAEFLMPSQEIGPYLNALSLPKLANLKPYWKVSMAALLQRATELAKLTERKARYLWMQMGKVGYRAHEPIDIPIEEPTLLQELISTHQNELHYSLSELSQMLAIHDHELRSMYLGQKTHLTLVKPKPLSSARVT